MTRILYLDCPTGIAGDMFLAAMADAGVDIKRIEEQLRQIDLGEWQLELSQVSKNGLAAKHIDITFPHQHQHRKFSDIKSLLAAVDWDKDALGLAQRIFLVLAAAEAEVHGCGIDDVHFHEVGAVDSIIDICGAALALTQLEIDQVYCSALPFSSGYVECAHGRLPVPAPATAVLLRGKRMAPSELVGETITPTGAAILVGSGAIQAQPAITFEKIGYGAGTRDFDKIPNVLRVFIGESSSAAFEQDWVEVLRTNIDDSSGELLGELWQKAFELGALDMSYSPLLMKKGRPGWALEMLVPCGQAQTFAELIFEETTTLGLRISREQRYLLPRTSEQLCTAYGEITIKISGNNIAPEAADVKAAAIAHNKSFKEVYQAAIAAYYIKNTP